MQSEPIVIAVALGPHVAALTCLINGRRTAVVNTLARTDSRIRNQAAMALLCAGIDAGSTMGAINGVRR